MLFVFVWLYLFSDPNEEGTGSRSRGDDIQT